MLKLRMMDLSMVARSDGMPMEKVLVIDRATGAFSRLKDEEPIKLRVCRDCGRVHVALEFSTHAA
jgi:hypothetical protein